MDIDRLKMFITVADCLNFTKAAEQLYISQPTLSRHISELEDIMQTELLERTTRKMSLTKAGKLFYAESVQIVNRYDALMQRVTRLGNGLSGSLRIGYLELFTQDILPIAIRTFHEKFPMVDLIFKETTLREANSMILSGDLDLCFMVAHEETQWAPELDHRRIFTGQVQLFVSNFHPLAKYQMVNPTMLKNEKILMYNVGETPDLQERIKQICLKGGFVPNFVYGNFSPGAIFLMVQAGQGVALLSSLITSILLTNERFHSLSLEGVQAVTNLELVWHKNNSNPCIQNFVTEVQEASHPGSTEE